jgi:hypothetical protein
MTLLHPQNFPFMHNICCKPLQLARRRKFSIVTQAAAHYTATKFSENNTKHPIVVSINAQLHLQCPHQNLQNAVDNFHFF